MKPLVLLMVFVVSASAAEKSKRKRAKVNPVAKKLFETNCLACHDPLKQIAGPTLYEINKLYEKNPEGIVSWAQKPGRRRLEGIAMPAMAHVPAADLKLIADYMLFAGSRVSRKELRKVNLFQEKLGKIQRTFMPNSSVVSFAISYSDDLSLCWDADKGITRYLWEGKLDPKSHFTGNGKVIPKIDGNIIYQSDTPIFQQLPDRIDYLGYKVNNQELPSFIYKRGTNKFIESHGFNDGKIYWKYQVEGPDQLSVNLPKVTGYEVSSNKGKIQNGTLSLNKRELASFTIILSRSK